MEGRFKDGYPTTIGIDFKTKVVRIGENKIRLQVRSAVESYHCGIASVAHSLPAFCELLRFAPLMICHARTHHACRAKTVGHTQHNPHLLCIPAH